MRKLFLLFSFCLVLAFLFFGLNMVLAQSCPSGSVCLPNPLGADPSQGVVLTLMGKIANGFIALSGSIALVMFVYGGFLWLTSQGEPDKIKKGKAVFIWSVVGLAVIFSSYMLVNMVIWGVTGAKEERCCVTKNTGDTYSCGSIPAGNDASANACAARGGDAVGDICANIVACQKSTTP